LDWAPDLEYRQSPSDNSRSIRSWVGRCCLWYLPMFCQKKVPPTKIDLLKSKLLLFPYIPISNLCFCVKIKTQI
jgi:hypothetical protein